MATGAPTDGGDELLLDLYTVAVPSPPEAADVDGEAIDAWTNPPAPAAGQGERRSRIVFDEEEDAEEKREVTTQESEEEDEEDEPTERSKRSRRGDPKDSALLELQDVAANYVVAHIVDVSLNEERPDGARVTLASGPPEGWAAHQTARRLAAWLRQRHEENYETQHVSLGKKATVVAPQMWLVDQAAAPGMRQPSDIPRVQDVLVCPAIADWVADGSRSSASAFEWVPLGFRQPFGRGAYWQAATRPASTRWDVVLARVKEPAALASALLLLETVPEEAPRAAGADRLPLVTVVKAIPFLDGTMAMKDGGFFDCTALCGWSLHLQPRGPATSSFQLAWSQLAIPKRPALPWSHLLRVVLRLMGNANTTVRTLPFHARHVRRIVKLAVAATHRANVPPRRLVARAKQMGSLRAALCEIGQEVGLSRYAAVVATLSPLLSNDRLEDVLRGGSLDALLAAVLASTGTPTLANLTSFNMADSLDAMQRVFRGMSVPQQLRAARDDTELLPDPCAVVMQPRHWYLMLIVARHTLCSAYELEDAAPDAWPWVSDACHSATASLLRAPKPSSIYWVSGHEVLAQPHPLLKAPSAPRDEEPVHPVQLEASMADLPSMHRWELAASSPWNGTYADVDGLYDAMEALVMDEHGQPTARRVHLVLGGAECPCHFALHFMRLAAHRLAAPQWPDATGDTCASTVVCSVGQWLPRAEVVIHSSVRPDAAALVRDPNEPWFVLHAHQVPPQLFRLMVEHAGPKRRVRIDVGTALDRPPPEFRWRKELAPWLRFLGRGRFATAAHSDVELAVPQHMRRWTAFWSALATTDDCRLFARQPLTASLRAMPPHVQQHCHWADLVLWPRVVYQQCTFHSASGCTAVVLDPELTVSEQGWLGSAMVVAEPGRRPEPAANVPSLWVSGDTAVADQYPYLPVQRDAQGRTLLHVWHPLVARLS